MKFIFGAILLALLALASAEQARFDNYRVYSIYIGNEKQLEVLKILENGVSSFYSKFFFILFLKLIIIHSTISGIIQHQ